MLVEYAEFLARRDTNSRVHTHAIESRYEVLFKKTAACYRNVIEMRGLSHRGLQ